MNSEATKTGEAKKESWEEGRNGYKLLTLDARVYAASFSRLTITEV